MKLFDAQARVVNFLHDTLKRFDGAVLRGEEGTGKTLMASTMAESYQKTLWVCPAGVIKDLRTKIDSYKLDVDIDLMSYHAFGNLKKTPAKTFKQYDFMIFDECHTLRNYKASWTTRFVKLRGAQQYLFLSGTPLLKSPKDFLYVLRKCGLWRGKPTEYFYKRYFGATQSKYGDFMELGDFQNKTCFQTQVDKVTTVIKHKDIDANMPDMNINIEVIEGDYEKPKDITEETKVRKAFGLKKVPLVAKAIRRDRKQKDIKTSLTLCYFHETARELHRVLGGTLALTSAEVQRAIETCRDETGNIITTVGLTNCSYNFNECDDVYIVESTYSFPLDRQSINRCRRIGKTNEVNVTYFTYAGEAPIVKSFQRQYLTESVDSHAKMGPSKLSRLEKCPGSYWLPDTLTRQDYIEAAAERGTKNHAALERYVLDPDADLEECPKEIVDCVKYCREHYLKGPCFCGIEEKVNAHNIHDELSGSCDFFAYNRKNKKLIVLDYKNGTAPVNVENNIQLLAYAYMIAHTYKLEVDTLTTIIYQKDKMKHCTYRENVLESIEKRLRKIVDAIMAAEKNPIEHLNKGKCDFFCTARKYHDQQEDKEMAKPRGKRGPKKTVHVLDSAYITFVKREESKRGEKLTLGLSFKDIPSSLKKQFAKGKPGSEKAIELLKKNKEYETRSLFANNLVEYIKNEEVLKLEKGDRVSVEFTAAHSEYEGKDYIFFNLRDAELLSDEREEDNGWDDEPQARHDENGFD